MGMKRTASDDIGKEKDGKIKERNKKLKIKLDENDKEGKKKKTKMRKEKRTNDEENGQRIINKVETENRKERQQDEVKMKKKPCLEFDYKYIVAPMVGASELPFRILCRKYGAQLVYTPMMLASQFATSEEYRKKEFQTTAFDRPLVCHFAANHPKEFAQAAKLAEPYCDAIDLNFLIGEFLIAVANKCPRL